jgi:hypothetical protein
LRQEDEPGLVLWPGGGLRRRPPAGWRRRGIVRTKSAQHRPSRSSTSLARQANTPTAGRLLRCSQPNKGRTVPSRPGITPLRTSSESMTHPRVLLPPPWHAEHKPSVALRSNLSPEIVAVGDIAASPGIAEAHSKLDDVAAWDELRASQRSSTSDSRFACASDRRREPAC